MNLENEFYVMDGMALDGQITLLYSKPNTGKTLIFMKLIIDGIEAEKIQAGDAGVCDCTDHVAGGGVDDIDRLAAGGWVPFVVD